MRCAFAVLAVGLLVAGCDEEQPVEQQVKKGPSLEEQYQKELKSELDKIQAQADRNIQKNIKLMQEAQESVKPKVPRFDKENERPELPSLRSSRDDNRWRSGN